MSYGNTRTTIKANCNLHNFTVPELLTVPRSCRKQDVQFLTQGLLLISFAAE